MNIIFCLEMLGTVAFAFSGAFVAIEKKMDVFGIAILGTTTAVGGGIVRDLLLGITPPMAFRQPIYALVAVATSLSVFFPFLRRTVQTRGQTVLLWMDSIGLAVFTTVGVRAGMAFENTFLAIFVGLLTGVGGGVLRDLFAGDRPMIFVRHFYASASLIGALITVVCWPFGESIAMLCGAVPIFALRLLAAHYKWHLPKIE